MLVLLAGSEPATILASCLDMDIDDAKQHPWLEYSVWHDQEWVRIYTPGHLQRWHRGDPLPDVPENSMRQPKHGTSVTGNTKGTSASCLGLSPSRLAIHMIRHLVKFETSMLCQWRRHSPMPLRFLKVIARLLRKSLQSSMATLAMLNVVIFRSRLLSGLGRCLAPLAVEDFLVNVRQLSVSI